MKNKLTCGTAKTDITPTQDMLMGVYGLGGIPFSGIIDPLHIRIIALSDGENKALLISFDLDKAPSPVTWLPEISNRTGIPEENITYIGTHTHTAPIISYRPRESRKTNLPAHMKKATHDYENMVHDKLMDSIDEALASMKIAKLGYEKSESFININRTAIFNYEGADGTIYPYVAQGPNNSADVDRTVFVLKIEDEEGAPIAFFVNYPMHCCTMFLNHFDKAGNMGISADIAGTVSRYIEDRFPGSIAIWSSGAAGDVNPIIANEVFYPSPKDGSRETFLISKHKVLNGLMISLAARHFEDILSAVRKIDNYSDDVTIKGAIEWSETKAVDLVSPEKGIFQAAGDIEEPYRIRLHLLRIGDVALYGIGGELFNSFGRQIITQSPFANTLVINHDASLIDDAGYIVDDETLGKIRRITPMSAQLPGKKSQSKKGQVSDSLKEHTQSLYNKVLN